LGKNGLKVDTQSINVSWLVNGLNGPIRSPEWLSSGLRVRVQVIGSKAILEGVVNGIQQKDGTPYQNK